MAGRHARTTPCHARFVQRDGKTITNDLEPYFNKNAGSIVFPYEWLEARGYWKDGEWTQEGIEFTERLRHA